MLKLLYQPEEKPFGKDKHAMTTKNKTSLEKYKKHKRHNH